MHVQECTGRRSRENWGNDEIWQNYSRGWEIVKNKDETDRESRSVQGTLLMSIFLLEREAPASDRSSAMPPPERQESVSREAPRSLGGSLVPSGSAATSL